VKYALSARWLSKTVMFTVLLWLTNEGAVAQQSQKVDLAADIFFASGSAVP
jgi:hypothetical protein